jgi:hypothetical protein
LNFERWCIILSIYFFRKIFPVFFMAVSVMGTLLHEPSDTTPNELRKQIEALSLQEPMIPSHPQITPITAPNQFRSLMDVWHTSNLKKPHLKDFARTSDPFSTGSTGPGKHSVLNQHHVVKSNGIPWAYTFGKAGDGSAWIFLYQQKLSEGQYFRDHHAGRKELIRTKSGFKYRDGIDVGNGQGLQYIGNGGNLENIAQLLSRKTKALSAGTPSAQPGSVPVQTKPDHQSEKKKSSPSMKKTSQHNPSGLPSVLDIPGVDKKYLLPPDYIIHVV